MTRRTGQHIPPVAAGGLLIALLLAMGLSWAYIALISMGMVASYRRHRRDDGDPPTPSREEHRVPTPPDVQSRQLGRK